MVERVVKLEKNTDTLRQDVTAVKEDVTVIKADVTTLTGDVNVLKEDVKELKTDMTELKSDVAVIKSNYTTKADLLSLENKFEGLRTELHCSLAMQTKWVVASQVGVLGLGLGLAKLLF